MTTTLLHNIGAFLAVATGILPQAVSANVNGAAIDRLAHNLPLSCVLHQVTGAAAGAPNAISVQTKLQHSPDGVNWTDYIAPGASAAAGPAALIAANTENTSSIDLASAQRFIRPVAVVALGGAGNPTILIAADIILGGELRSPAI